MEDDEAAVQVPLAAVAFDPVIHQPARLKILMLLAALGSASFHTLGKEAELTAGNLQNHLKALEKADYVASTRRLIDLKPRMRYTLTPGGAAALQGYCRALEAALAGIRGVMASPGAQAAGGAGSEAAATRPK